MTKFKLIVAGILVSLMVVVASARTGEEKLPEVVPMTGEIQARYQIILLRLELIQRDASDLQKAALMQAHIPEGNWDKYGFDVNKLSFVLKSETKTDSKKK